MPIARQLCQGSSRQVEVKRFKDNDKQECPSCNAKPTCIRRVFNRGQLLMYEVPPHVADGVRDSSKIDWSNV